MKFLSIGLAIFFITSNTIWEHDFDTAQQKAKSAHKLILLNFSGSDWCVPCIRLKKDMFETEAFQNFATNNLVLLKADFPRLKKNQLTKEQKQKNNKLADSYNPHGNFPFTLLLDTDGKILKTWEGYPDMTPEAFLQQIKTFIDDRN